MGRDDAERTTRESGQRRIERDERSTHNSSVKRSLEDHTHGRARKENLQTQPSWEGKVNDSTTTGGDTDTKSDVAEESANSSFAVDGLIHSYERRMIQDEEHEDGKSH